MKTIPIPNATPKQQTALASQCMDAQKADPQADVAKFEKKIDDIVYRLFDLSEEEIRIVEGGGRNDATRR